jgi:putative SOS response-associated peptidase YedK
MCGRFTLRARLNRILQELGLADDLAWEPRYNIAPTQNIPIVQQEDANGKRSCALVRWDLVPSWAKDMSKPITIARAETVAEKPSFRSAFKRKRCLVLADGYYEFAAQGKTKQPFYIRLKSELPFAFAALSEHWQGADGSPLESCAIITTTPNELTGRVHDRMPVILDDRNWDEWLSLEAKPESLKNLLKQYPSNRMVMYPVSTLVNSYKNDMPECILPLSKPLANINENLAT